MKGGRARIEAVAPDHIWTETAGVHYNATQNNNIAWRNVHVVHGILVGGVGEEAVSYPVILRNTLPISRTLAIQLRVAEGSEGFFDQGHENAEAPTATNITAAATINVLLIRLSSLSVLV